MLCPLTWTEGKSSVAALPFPYLQSEEETGRLFTMSFKNTVVKTPFSHGNNNTGHWEYTETFGEYAVKEYCGLLASFHYSGHCYNPFYTTKNALCVRCTRVRVWVCVACDRTKMLGYHALMCMPNPLVLSHNLPLWLCRFSSASRGLGRAAAQEAGHDPS